MRKCRLGESFQANITRLRALVRARAVSTKAYFRRVLSYAIPRRADLYSFYSSKGIQGKRGILFADFVCSLERTGRNTREILAEALRCV